MNNSKIILKKLFAILDDSKIDYCVQNKYENMPNKIPSDIDIFYNKATERYLDYIVQLIADSCNLRIIQKTTMGYWGFVYMLNKISPKKGFQLQLDFQKDFSTRKHPNVFLGKPCLNRKRRLKHFYILSPQDEVKLILIRRTIKKDFNNFYLDRIIKLCNENTIENFNNLKKSLPEKIFKILIKMINEKQISIYHKNQKLFQNFVNKESRKNSSFVRKFSQTYFNLFYQFKSRIIRPMGLTIALISPDGGGKSSVIEGLENTCLGCFHGIEKKYFRPGLLKNIGFYNPVNPTKESLKNPNPHSVKTDSFLKSLIRFIFYNLDFVFGYFLVVYRLKVMRKLIIFDRYYYDYFVDMKRHKLNLPYFLPRIFFHLVPKPDILFILDAPEDIIFRRKQELSLYEIKRQRLKFLQISKIIKKSYIINTNRPLKDVISDITTKIVIEKLNQTYKKLKI